MKKHESPRQVRIVVQHLIDEMERADITTITIADLRLIVQRCDEALKR